MQIEIRYGSTETSSPKLKREVTRLAREEAGLFRLAGWLLVSLEESVWGQSVQIPAIGRVLSVVSPTSLGAVGHPTLIRANTHTHKDTDRRNQETRLMLLPDNHPSLRGVRLSKWGNCSELVVA